MQAQHLTHQSKKKGEHTPPNMIDTALKAYIRIKAEPQASPPPIPAKATSC